MGKSVFQWVTRLWVIQLVLLGISSGVLYGFNPVLAYSFALGAMNFVLPNAYFAIQALRHSGVKTQHSEALAQQVLKNFYRAETNKFVLAATGFAVIFSIVRPLSGLALFGGFITMMVCQLLVASRWQFD